MKHSEIAELIAAETGRSHHLVKEVLRETIRVIQENIEKGVGVDLPIFSIQYTIPKDKGSFYGNKSVSWNRVVHETYYRLAEHNPDVQFHEVMFILERYAFRLKYLVSCHQDVTVKGVGYVYSDGSYRISPALKKCDSAVFILAGDEPHFKTFYRSELSLSLFPPVS